MLGVDLLLLWLAHKIWPDEPKPNPYAQPQSRGHSEDSANWIILDDMNRQIGDEEWSNNTDTETGESDPYLDGDYHGGPDW